MEALFVHLPRNKRTNLVIYRHRKLTRLPCVSLPDGPQILLVPVQLDSYMNPRIATTARPTTVSAIFCNPSRTLRHVRRFLQIPVSLFARL
jgi:hypothetical protein